MGVCIHHVVYFFTSNVFLKISCSASVETDDDVTRDKTGTNDIPNSSGSSLAVGG